MLKSFWRTDEPGSEAGGLCSDFRGLGGRVKRVRMWREAAFRRRPGRRQLPAVWRANPAPRGGPSRCGRHSPECASSSHSTACADLAAPSSPPQTQRRERPVKWTGEATWHLSLIKITCLFFFLYTTCLFAKMSSKASRSSFSVSSLASSLWASMSLSRWQLSITNTTAAQIWELKERDLPIVVCTPFSSRLTTTMAMGTTFCTCSTKRLTPPLFC